VHEPVLVDEVIALLRPRADGTYVDCTIGFGGHTVALLQAGAGRVIGVDRDEQALTSSRDRLASFGARVTLVHADYRELERILRTYGTDQPDGIVADLGVSSRQLDDPERGFSFRHDGPLDMRMDTSRGQTAADLIRTADERTLADMIFRFGEERHARRIARAIVRARDERPITRTGELAQIVRRAAGGRGWQRIDPATRTFQALRIWVNGELDGLDTFLDSAAASLARGGRLAVIAFHSLEDRIVKRTFLRLAGRGSSTDAEHGAQDPGRPARVVELVTRKPIVPSEAEIGRNPRARSARLRAVEKVA
jgi:16S rRNA (cytosine1402-N4)-methyltransferase